MNTLTECRSLLSVAVICTVAAHGGPAEPWRAVEQPDLKQALDRAPVLQTESLGEPARGVNVWERWFVPNRDGKSWDVLHVCQIDPDENGNAGLWHRSREDVKAKRRPDSASAEPRATPEELGWRSIRLEGVPTYPHRLNPLSVLPDGRLYGTGDDYAGTFIFTKSLPSPASTDDYWPHWVDPSYEYHAFERGPDGFIRTYLKDVLVRIDPQDAHVHVVGRVEPVGWPTFVGRDVYLAGSETLRRIRRVVPDQNGEVPQQGAPE